MEYFPTWLALQTICAFSSSFPSETALCKVLEARSHTEQFWCGGLYKTKEEERKYIIVLWLIE
jgi:hypothetical protein